MAGSQRVTPSRELLVDLALLQVVWFAAVLGGDLGATAAGALLAALVLRRGHVERDLTVAAVTAATGLGLDTAWIWAGALDYHGAPVAPLWIVVLWACVGLSANHAFARWLGRPWLAGALAAAACPLSYLAGASFGAVRLPEPPLLVLVAAAWAVVFAALLGWVAPFFNRQFEEVVR